MEIKTRYGLSILLIDNHYLPPDTKGDFYDVTLIY
jgi:hypothetical protein